MLRTVVYTLWLVLPPLQSAIAYRMWRQRSYRDYPLFFAYILEQLVRFPILFYYYQMNVESPYRHAWTFFQAIEAILQIGIICELFSDVFSPYEGIRHFGAAILRWTSVFFLLAAILVATYSVGADSSKVLARIFAMSRSVEIVQAGLLLLLALSSSLLALEWKPRTMWIALGVGLFTGVDLVAYTIRYQSGMASQQLLSLIANVSYDLALLFWIRAFYFQPALAAGRDQVSEDWDVQSWNRALLQLLRR